MPIGERWEGLYKPEHGPFYSYDWGKPSKIALLGTCSVGKSSILKHFKDNNVLPNGATVGYVDEVAERFFREGITMEQQEALEQNRPRAWGELPYSATHWITSLPRTWWWTQDNIGTNIHMAEEDARAQYMDVLLCDRSIVCPMVYTAAHGDMEHADNMMERMYWWLPTYSELALLDPEGVPYVQTNIRSETPEERLAIHDAYIEFCGKFGIPYTIVSGSLEDRIAQVQGMLVTAYEDLAEPNRL